MPDAAPNIPALAAWFLEHHAAAFLFTVGRLAGLFLLSPLLSSLMIPNRIKIIIIFFLAAAVYPLAPAITFSPDLFSLVGIVITEAMIGYVIGALAAIPMLSLEMSGVIAGQQMGLGLARVYNPESDSEADTLGQLLYFIALAGFLVQGGLDRLLGCVIDSLHTIAVGDAIEAPMTLLVNTVTAGFELAMRITTPVSAAVLLMTITLGAVGKTMPQINIMSVGFTFKIAIGLLALLASIVAVALACGDALAAVFHDIEAWVRNPAMLQRTIDRG